MNQPDFSYADGAPSAGAGASLEAVPDTAELPSTERAADLAELLRQVLELGASDLHITPGVPPQVRIDGTLRPMEYARLAQPETQELLSSVMTEDQKATLEENLEVDFSFGLKDMARFRANVFVQRGSIAGALRLIPWSIPSFEDLGLPSVIADICEKPRGLVLVTGPTGSGKSTTLAAMIDLINRQKAHHIITIEDPIEYLHGHQRSIVNQRELGADTLSFAAAMRSALREDPDCVLIGEMRDLESTELALKLAETGHLTFATLHTNSAVQTINRVIDIFPTGQQAQIRTQLSFTLVAAISQTLLPHSSGSGRVLAQEILVMEEKITSEVAIAASGEEKELSAMLERFNDASKGRTRLDREVAERVGLRKGKKPSRVRARRIGRGR